jgi:hypothetical protein
MTVEQNLEALDQFPVGMRVLAVDDDQTCLKILESLLRHCQYHGSSLSLSLSLSLSVFLDLFFIKFLDFMSL